MEEIVDPRKVNFSSSNQFLIGEKVIVKSCTSGPAGTGYRGLITLIGYVYSNASYNITNGYSDYGMVQIHIPGTGNYNVNVQDLDLAIEDAELYNCTKISRLNYYKLHLEYRVRETELIKARLYASNKDVLDLFEEIYPNHFDYNFNNSLLNCIIHFPEITIRNSRNQSHKIVDLYVKLSFSSDKKLREITGTRSVITLAERLSGYRHSHMSAGGNFFDWLPCCLGESEFAQTRSLLSNSFNVNNLTRFLYQLPEYLAWESLEGGPYRKLDTVVSPNNAPPTVNITLIESVYRSLMEKSDYISTNINKSTSELIQIDEASLEEMLLPLAGSYTCNKVNSVYTLDGNSGNNSNLVSRYNSEIPNNHIMFNFKGVDIKPKVIMGEAVQTGTKAPYPSLTKGVSKLLTNNINNYVTSQANS